MICPPIAQPFASRARQLAMLLILTPSLAFPAGAAHAEPLPASALSTGLSDIDRHTHRLDDWKGKLRVVNFWATWCLPCRSEIPVLQGASTAWRKENVVVIGVALDNADDVRDFARQAGIDYPLLIAEEQGPALMQSGGNHSGALPYTVLVDGRGNILQRHTGPIDAPLLRQWLNDALAKK